MMTTRTGKPRAMTKFINSRAPVLRDLQLPANLETHGDETAFEAIRLIEEIGADVVGVTFDPGNLPLQGDVPLEEYCKLTFADAEKLADYQKGASHVRSIINARGLG